MMDFSLIADNLENSDGVWQSKHKRAISYPESGNQDCFQLEENSFWFAHRNKCITELVKHFAPDKYLFDIGGGNGFVSLSLERAGLNTVLVEPGVQGVANAKKRGLKNLICSSLEDASFHPASMDAVGLFDVIEHINDDMTFLKNTYELVSNNGMVFITVPAYQFLWSGADILAGHYRRYTLKSLAQVLAKAGFEVKYKTYFFSLLPIPIFLFRSIPDKFRKIEEGRAEGLKEDHKKSKFSKLFEWELKQVRNLRTIPFGGSCLVVASKRV